MSELTVPNASSESLDKLSEQIKASDEIESWRSVTTQAKSIADKLRDKSSSEVQDSLGQSHLPKSLASLVRSALEHPGVPADVHADAVFELMRVGANLCSDHNVNRKQLLDAGFLAAIINLLERFNNSIPSYASSNTLKLSKSQLQLAKTAIGCILNASIGYGPVKSALRSLKTVEILLRLSSAIYPAGAWAIGDTLDAVPGTSAETVAELWSIRATLSNWSWREITELREDAESFLGPDVLCLLTPPLRFFAKPYPSPLAVGAPPPSTTLLQTDFEILEESCSLIESLCLDVEDVRLSLARGLVFPEEHQGVQCFSDMLDFIETANHPKLWTAFGEADKTAKERSFDFFKAAVIKSVVEVAAEENNADVLWDAGEETSAGGIFVCRMVQWLRSFVEAPEKLGREDLAICATLTLANLATRESFSKTLLSPPHSIVSLLSPLVAPSFDMRVRHGVVGLLKHLAQSSAQSPENRKIIEDEGVIPAIVASGIWDDTKDALAEVVQINAFGIVKYLCNGSVSATYAVVLPVIPASLSGITQILALVRRSDTIAIKSEGTRVVVNVIKTLWSAENPSNPAVDDRRQQAMEALLIPDCAEALARLIGRSMKYPLLVNEAVVALSLMATHDKGVTLVLNAITSALPAEASPAGPSISAIDSAEASLSSNLSSPVATSPPNPLRANRRQADQLLVAILRNAHGANRTVPVSYPPEVRMNICSLFAQISKKGSGDPGSSLRAASKPVLEDLSKNAGLEGKEALLGTAAVKTLQAYESAS